MKATSKSTCMTLCPVFFHARLSISISLISCADDTRWSGFTTLMYWGRDLPWSRRCVSRDRRYTKVKRGEWRKHMATQQKTRPIERQAEMLRRVAEQYPNRSSTLNLNLEWTPRKYDHISSLQLAGVARGCSGCGCAHPGRRKNLGVNYSENCKCTPRQSKFLEHFCCAGKIWSFN